MIVGPPRSLAGTGDIGIDVSRETEVRLKTYLDLLTKWQRKINLVSPNTIQDAWRRHFLDSLQIIPHIPPATQHWLDFGSGAGFPGLVGAIVLQDIAPQTKVTLIESDARKCSFLREVARQTNTAVTVLTARIESAQTQPADLITARALAPLDRLLEFSKPHLMQGGLGLFPKGARYLEELATAQQRWQFKYDAIQSQTSQDSVILKIREISDEPTGQS